MDGLAEAKNYLDQQEPLKALEILEFIKGDSVADRQFDFLYGLANGWSGNFDRGIEYLNRALSAGVSPFWVLFNRGTFEHQRENSGKAVSDLLAAMMLEPEHEEPRTFLIEKVLPNAPGVPEWLETFFAAMFSFLRSSSQAQEARLSQIDQRLDELQRDLVSFEDRDRDVLLLLTNKQNNKSGQVTVETEHPVALESADHRFPRGTQHDNTRHPRFVYACERLFRRKVRHLDLGCAGGGLVWDFLIEGNQSYGIEGSDYSLLNRRAEWRLLKDSLFLADITKDFFVRDLTGQLVQFDVITAWEVLEHISEDDLAGLLFNINRHLSPGGVFAASVALFEDQDQEIGAKWHVTLQPKPWWDSLFREHGFEMDETIFEIADFPRGTGNPRAQDWNVLHQPELGFHIVCKKSAASC